MTEALIAADTTSNVSALIEGYSPVVGVLRPDSPPTRTVTRVPAGIGLATCMSTYSYVWRSGSYGG